MKSKAATIIMGIVFFLIIGVIVLFGTILWNKYMEIKEANSEPENFQTEISDNTNITKNETKTPEVSENPFNNIKNNKSKNQSKEEKTIDYSDIVINKHFYNQLDDYAKTIYRAFEKNRENMKSGIYKVNLGNTFTSLLNEEGGSEKLSKFYQSAIEAYTYDNPDVFYLNPNKMYLNVETTTKSNKTTYNVFVDNGKAKNYFIEEFSSREEIDNAINKIEQVRNQILQNKRSNTYDNIKLVHDYLVENIEYDRSISKGNIYNIYGALVNGVSVCEGYARSFKYLMDVMRN